MQGHDELSALFSRNLTFNPQLPPPQQEPAPEPVHSQPIIYSISRHYHHSSHTVRPQPQALQRSSSEPEQGHTDALEHALRIHGVNPSTLTPSQIQLFRTADEAQQLRLVELWNICPPSVGEHIPPQAWSSTSVAEEEQLAQMRYEKTHGVSMGGTVVQSTDGTWAHDQSDSDTEPYMVSGYQELMHRDQARDMQARTLQSGIMGNSADIYGGQQYSRATDPVFMGPDSVRQQQQQQQQQQHIDLAMQYGAYDQFRSTPGDVLDVM